MGYLCFEEKTRTEKTSCLKEIVIKVDNVGIE